MSDLLAKCDWDEDELHVYLTEWPDVVYVWVDEKTMPFVPVGSKSAENKELREFAKMAMYNGCIGCPHKKMYKSCDGCHLYEWANKLGIEVME